MKEQVVESWEHFQVCAKEIDQSYKFVGTIAHAGIGVAFRGDSIANRQGPLKPTLLRHFDKVDDIHKALTIEKLTVRRFDNQAYEFLPPHEFFMRQDILSVIALMQHHGAPTRMLDWSKSIYVAAFFAVEKNPRDAGAIWLVNVAEVNKFMHNGTTDEDRNKVMENVCNRSRDLTGGIFDPIAEKRIIFSDRRLQSDRMIAQQGVFSFCENLLGDQQEIFEKVSAGVESANDKTFAFGRLVIPAKRKPEFLSHLEKMNITPASLFPGIDGVGRSIEKMVSLMVPA